MKRLGKHPAIRLFKQTVKFLQNSDMLTQSDGVMSWVANRLTRAQLLEVFGLRKYQLVNADFDTHRHKSVSATGQK